MDAEIPFHLEAVDNVSPLYTLMVNVVLNYFSACSTEVGRAIWTPAITGDLRSFNPGRGMGQTVPASDTCALNRVRSRIAEHEKKCKY